MTISGSAWMFYNQYNPQLLDALQQVIAGTKVEDVVNGLLEGSSSYSEKVRKITERHYKKFPVLKNRTVDPGTAN